MRSLLIARPHHPGFLGADVVGHARGARREDREVAPALLLELDLRLHALQQLLVGDAELRRRGLAHGIGEPRELLVAEGEELLRLRRVVPVNIDDHAASRN
jgi:hypothetical protein